MKRRKEKVKERVRVVRKIEKKRVELVEVKRGK